MTEPTPGQQPMEDILASIRRIIAEDPPIVGPASAAMPDEGEEEEDVLELGEAAPMPAAPAAAPSFTPPPVAAPVAPAAPPTKPVASLVSGQAAEASRKALEALSGIRIDPRADDHTLDGLVREMLRPLLKDWLDANLPDLVERVVTREIARIGGR